MWCNAEQKYKMNGICLTFCVLVAAMLFHLKSISYWKPFTLHVFVPLHLRGCIRASGDVKSLL